MDGHHFAGTTQLISSTSCSSAEAAEAAASMAVAVADELPQRGSAQLYLRKDAFKFKEFRTATKQLLSAVANSVQTALPEGFTLQSACPPNLLKPAGPQCQRYSFRATEVEALGQEDDGLEHYFLYDFESRSAQPDYYKNDDFYHLCFAADEGTEAGWQGGCLSAVDIRTTKKEQPARDGWATCTSLPRAVGSLGGVILFTRLLGRRPWL